MSEDNPRKLKKLVKELERAAKDDPGNLVSKVKLAGAYRDLGQKIDAIKLYREVAHAYEAQGRRAQAVAVCRGILEIDPGEGETRVLLSRLESEAAAEPAGSGLPLPLLPGTMQGAVPAMPPRPAWLPKTSRGFASPTVPPPLLTPTPGPTPLPAPFPLGEDDLSTSAGSLWRMPSEPLILRGPPPPVQSGEPTFSGSQLPAPPSQRLESVIDQPTELRAASGPQRVQAPPQGVVERMPPGQEEEDAPTFMQEVTPLRPMGGALESRRSPLSGPSSLPPSSLPLSAPPLSAPPLSAPPPNVAPAQLHSPPPSVTQPMAVPTPLPPPPLRLSAQQASSPPPSVTQPMAVPTPLPPPPLPALSSPALPLPSPPMLPALPTPSLSSPALPLPSPPSLGGRDDLDLMETHKVDRLEAADLFPPRQNWSEDTNPRSLQTMTAEVVSVADVDGEHTSPGEQVPHHESEAEYTPARRERRTRRMGSVAPPPDPDLPALAPTPRPPLGERLPPARPEPALPAAPPRTPATGARVLAADARGPVPHPAEPRPPGTRSTGSHPVESRAQDPRATAARPAEPRPLGSRSSPDAGRSGPGELRPGELRPGELRPGELRGPGGLRPLEPRATAPAAPASPRSPEPRPAAPASPRSPEPRAGAPGGPRAPSRAPPSALQARRRAATWRPPSSASPAVRCRCGRPTRRRLRRRGPRRRGCRRRPSCPARPPPRAPTPSPATPARARCPRRRPAAATSRTPPARARRCPGVPMTSTGRTAPAPLHRWRATAGAATSTSCPCRRPRSTTS